MERGRRKSVRCVQVTGRAHPCSEERKEKPPLTTAFPAALSPFHSRCSAPRPDRKTTHAERIHAVLELYQPPLPFPPV